jgi:phage terminase large subunit
VVCGERLQVYRARNSCSAAGSVSRAPDALRGPHLDGVVLDEFADMKPEVWYEVVRPMLADRQGFATFIGTPKGPNEFWRLYENAKKDPSWFRLD